MLLKDNVASYKKLKRDYKYILKNIEEHGNEYNLDSVITIDGVNYDLKDSLLEIFLTARLKKEFYGWGAIWDKTDIMDKDIAYSNKFRATLSLYGKVIANPAIDVIKQYLFYDTLDILPFSNVYKLKRKDIDVALMQDSLLFGLTALGTKNANTRVTLEPRHICGIIAFYILLNSGYITSVPENSVCTLCDLNLSTGRLDYRDYCYWLEGLEHNIDIGLVTASIKYIATMKSSDVTNEFREYLREFNRAIKERVQDIDISDSEYIDAIERISSDIEDIRYIITYINAQSKGTKVIKLSKETDTTELNYGDLFVETICKIFEDSNAINSDVFSGVGYKNIRKAINYGLNTYVDIQYLLIQDRVSSLETKAKENDKLNAEYEQLRTGYKKYKSQVKQLNNELKETNRQLDLQKRKSEKQVDFIEKLKQQGAVNTEPLEAEITRLNGIIEESNNQDRLNKTTIEKYKRQLGNMEATNRQLLSRVGELEAQNKNITEQAVLSNNINSNIPIDCYIRAIRNKKITIYGGDMMHSGLRQLGFRNLKLFGADNRTQSFNDFAYQDLIVIVTGYMAHSTYHIPKGAAEKANIPILYFNNKNISLLVQEMFKVFYSEEYNMLRKMKRAQ